LKRNTSIATAQLAVLLRVLLIEPGWHLLAELFLDPPLRTTLEDRLGIRQQRPTSLSRSLAKTASCNFTVDE
jgi:hypothetical protein